MRRDSAAKSIARAIAPIVVSPIEMRLMGPTAPSDVARLKILTPTMLPTTSAVAALRPGPSAGFAGDAGAAADTHAGLGAALTRDGDCR